MTDFLLETDENCLHIKDHFGLTPNELKTDIRQNPLENQKNQHMEKCKIMINTGNKIKCFLVLGECEAEDEQGELERLFEQLLKGIKKFKIDYINDDESKELDEDKVDEIFGQLAKFQTKGSMLEKMKSRALDEAEIQLIFPEFHYMIIMYTLRELSIIIDISFLNCDIVLWRTWPLYHGKNLTFVWCSSKVLGNSCGRD